MLLAGPILRRVDAKSVNVWIALDEAGEVTLSLKDGQDNVAGQSTTIKDTKVGNKLFIHLITFTPGTGLRNDKVYAYDLKKNGTSILSDLVSATQKTPIGYEAGALPSFALPATDLKDLVVAHGSCRKMHGNGPEALSNLDEHIKANRASPKTRIQQLFLTGDQIYADEIPIFALWSITEKAKELISEKEDLPLPSVTVDGVVRAATRINPSLALPGLRSPLLNLYAKMTTSGSSHLLSFGEYCLAHLHAWSPDVWKPDLKSAAEKYAEIDNNWNKFKTGTGFTKENYRDREYLHHKKKEDFDKVMSDFPAYEKRQKFNMASELKNVANFLETLPAVRRVLANTPTYMIFDDHEITDDWNISMKWKNQVYMNSLGKAIVRNGLMAYTLCQDLGNSPDDYKKEASKKNSLLEKIKTYANTTNFSTFSTDGIDQLLGIATPDAQPQVDWHFLIKSGDKVSALFLDTRNRRGFTELNSRPALLDDNAFKTQFKFQATPAADETLFVISACPAIGLSVFEDIIYPIATSIKGVSSGDGSFASGQLIFDNEAWYLNSKAYEELLNRMSAFKKAVIFSGDVHYGFTTVLDYWKKETQPNSRFIQLVSSALKNLWKKNIRLFQSGFTQGVFAGFGGKVEKFGWTSSPTVTGVDISLVNRRRLRETPAVIDNFGLQKTVKITPDSDWRYRLSVPIDERKDADIEHLDEDVFLTDSFDHKKIEDIRTLAARFTKDFSNARSRRLMYATHVCVVSFKDEKLIHTFLYRSAEKPELVLKMVHEVPLSPVSDDEKRRPEFPVT